MVDEKRAAGGRPAIILLSNDLSHPALSKQQFAFSWRINRLRPLLKKGYTIVLVVAGGTVGPKGWPRLSSLKPAVRNDGSMVVVSPPVLRIPMLWLLQSMLITPLTVFLYCKSNDLDVRAVVAASVPYGVVGKALNRLLKTSLIVDYGDPDYARERSLSLRVLHILETYVLGKGGVRAVTCIDPNIRTYVGRYRVKKAVFLPPGGYWKGSAQPAANELRDGTKRIVYAGHLAPPPAYRLDLLIEAAPKIFAQHPEARLELVGNGEYLPTIRRRARELGIEDRIDLPGAVPYEEARRRIAEADVAVQLLNDMCLGTKVLDYFALGKAVVSCGSFFDSYTEFLENGVNCLLVPPEKDRFADAIDLLLSRGDLRETMGQNALKTVSAYDWDSQADRLLELLNDS
jgi:glycosyltransferase involved in cell wall biosynthesis